MLVQAKRLSVLMVAILAVASAAQAQDYAPDAPRTAVLRKIFGDTVVKGLDNLPLHSFKGAREIALELAQKVNEHSLSVKEARSSLLSILVKMDQGLPAADMSEVEFEVVGIMPRGESPAGLEVPGASEAIVASAPLPDSVESPGSSLDAAPAADSEPDLDGDAQERHVSSIGS